MQTRSIPLASFGLAMRRRFWLLAAALAVGAAGVTAVPQVANAPVYEAIRPILKVSAADAE